MRTLPFAIIVWLGCSIVACGGGTTPADVVDGSSADTTTDASADTSDVGDITAMDASDAADTAEDVTTTDAPIDTGADIGSDVLPDAGPDAQACSEAGACMAIAPCMCGRCDPTMIYCGTMDTCGLGCAQSCPELSLVQCTCTGGRCARLEGNHSGTAGTSCASDSDCMSGLLCCGGGAISIPHSCTVPVGGVCPAVP